MTGKKIETLTYDKKSIITQLLLCFITKELILLKQFIGRHTSLELNTSNSSTFFCTLKIILSHIADKILIRK